MISDSCFTVLNSDESKKVLNWAKIHADTHILQNDDEVEIRHKINLIIEKNPEI